MKNGGSFHSYVNVYQRVDCPRVYPSYNRNCTSEYWKIEPFTKVPCHLMRLWTKEWGTGRVMHCANSWDGREPSKPWWRYWGSNGATHQRMIFLTSKACIIKDYWGKFQSFLMSIKEVWLSKHIQQSILKLKFRWFLPNPKSKLLCSPIAVKRMSIIFCPSSIVYAYIDWS